MSRPDAQGSGTMLIVAVMLVLLTVAVAIGTFAGYAVAEHRATNAADLAALAGAQAQGNGESPCPAATPIARANGGTVRSCSVVGTVSDFVVTVTVALPVPYPIPGLSKTVQVEANAGPVR